MSEWVSDCGNARLILGDCLEVLPSLAQVDAVITDPPFSEHTHGNAKSNRNGGTGKKAIDFKAIDFKAIEKILDQLAEICSGWVIANMEWRHIAKLEFNPHHFFELVRFGVWVKTNPMPQISADRPANGWEGLAYLFPRGKRKWWNGGGCHGNYVGPVVTTGDHPTAKPIELVGTWVDRFSNKSETILDPFMGSGTTGVACIRAGRKFIGIEREPKYFEIAKKRIQDELGRFPLLEQAAPSQLNLID